MPFTYILKCSDDSLYTGAAKNVYARLQKHQKGKAAKYTRGRQPVRLIYYEYYHTMNQALKREKEIQKFTKHKKERLVLGIK